MDNKDVSAQALREAAEKIFHDQSFTVNSNRIGESLRDAGGAKRAIDEIFLFKTGQGITS